MSRVPVRDVVESIIGGLFCVPCLPLLALFLRNATNALFMTLPVKFWGRSHATDGS
jgi:hypothetical protein